jgi:Flp pilus assembly protein TadD
VEIDAGNAQAHYNLGLLSARAGRLGEAEAHFAKAQALDPDDADIARALAEVRAQRGVR